MLSFSHSTKLIGIPQADAQPLSMQELINAIRTEEASERGITEPQIATAAGKDDLGGGVLVGITVNLLSSWKLSFAAGAYQATINGGNLSDALARIDNTGSPQVLVQASAAATLVNGGATTPSEPASGWSASNGGTDLWSMIDETVPDDNDYIYSSTTGQSHALALPANCTSFSLRASSSTGNGLSVTIKDGATTIATRTLTLTPTFDLHTITLTSGEIAAITSGNLTVEMTST